MPNSDDDHVLRLLHSDELPRLKQVFPHVYQYVLEAEQRRRTLEAQLKAKESELQRCIYAGEELLAQLDAVVRPQTAEIHSPDADQKTLLAPAAAAPLQKHRRATTKKRRSEGRERAASDPSLRSACVLLAQIFPDLQTLLRDTQQLVRSSYYVAQHLAEEDEREATPDEKTSAWQEWWRRQQTVAGKEIHLEGSVPATPWIPPLPSCVTPSAGVGVIPALRLPTPPPATEVDRDAPLAKWCLAAVQGVHALLHALRQCLPHPLAAYGDRIQAALATERQQKEALQLEKAALEVQLAKQFLRHETLASTPVEPKAPPTARQRLSVPHAVEVEEHLLDAAGLALARQKEELTAVHQLAVQQVEARLGDREAELLLATRRIAEGLQREKALRSRVKLLEQEAVEGEAERQLLRQQRRHDVQQFDREKKEIMEKKEASDATLHAHHQQQQARLQPSSSSSLQLHPHYVLQSERALQAEWKALYARTQEENHRLEEELFALKKQRATNLSSRAPHPDVVTSAEERHLREREEREQQRALEASQEEIESLEKQLRGLQQRHATLEEERQEATQHLQEVQRRASKREDDAAQRLAAVEEALQRSVAQVSRLQMEREKEKQQREAAEEQWVQHLKEMESAMLKSQLASKGRECHSLQRALDALKGEKEDVACALERLEKRHLDEREKEFALSRAAQEKPALPLDPSASPGVLWTGRDEELETAKHAAVEARVEVEHLQQSLERQTALSHQQRTALDALRHALREAQHPLEAESSHRCAALHCQSRELKREQQRHQGSEDSTPASESARHDVADQRESPQGLETSGSARCGAQLTTTPSREDDLRAELSRVRDELVTMSQTLSDRESQLREREDACGGALQFIQESARQDVALHERREAEWRESRKAHPAAVPSEGAASPPTASVAGDGDSLPLVITEGRRRDTTETPQRAAYSLEGVEAFRAPLTLASLQQHRHALDVLRQHRQSQDQLVWDELVALRRANEAMTRRLRQSEKDRSVVRLQLQELLTTPPRLTAGSDAWLPSVAAASTLAVTAAPAKPLRNEPDRSKPTTRPPPPKEQARRSATPVWTGRDGNVNSPPRPRRACPPPPSPTTTAPEDAHEKAEVKMEGVKDESMVYMRQPSLNHRWVQKEDRLAPNR